MDYHIYPTPPLGEDMTQGQFFKRSLTGLNSEFSFSYSSCHTNAEEPCLSFYLPIAGGRIFGFIPFPRVLVLCEMQSVRFRIWTRVAVSTSSDDNHYTTGTSYGLFRQQCFIDSSLAKDDKQIKKILFILNMMTAFSYCIAEKGNNVDVWNIICFLFFFLLPRVRGSSKRESKKDELHTQEPSYESVLIRFLLHSSRFEMFLVT